jgi:hypothetical protein
VIETHPQQPRGEKLILHPGPILSILSVLSIRTIMPHLPKPRLLRRMATRGSPDKVGEGFWAFAP